MPTANASFPPPWRIFIAFALTPLINAIALALIFPGFGGYDNFPESIYWTTLNYALFGVYPIVVIFGIPTFFILRTRVSATALNCVRTGALIASALVFLLSAFSRPQYEFVYGHALVVNGAMTLWGWLYLLLNCVEAALFGAFGGLVFWAIAALGTASVPQKS